MGIHGHVEFTSPSLHYNQLEDRQPCEQRFDGTCRQRAPVRPGFAQVDSSEFYSSEHDSIYNAATSPSSPDRGSFAFLGTHDAWPGSRDERYVSPHIPERSLGTKLSTILEQPSISTLEPQSTRLGLKRKLSILLRRPTQAARLASQTPVPCFTADALDDACLQRSRIPKHTPSRTTTSDSSAQSLQTIPQPNQPPFAPPERTPTPRGVPRWPLDASRGCSEPAGRDDTSSRERGVAHAFQNVRSQGLALRALIQRSLNGLPSMSAAQRQRFWRPQNSGHSTPHLTHLGGHPFHSDRLPTSASVIDARHDDMRAVPTRISETRPASLNKPLPPCPNSTPEFSNLSNAADVGENAVPVTLERLRARPSRQSVSLPRTVFQRLPYTSPPAQASLPISDDRAESQAAQSTLSTKQLIASFPTPPSLHLCPPGSEDSVGPCQALPTHESQGWSLFPNDVRGAVSQSTAGPAYANQLAHPASVHHRFLGSDSSDISRHSRVPPRAETNLRYRRSGVPIYDQQQASLQSWDGQQSVVSDNEGLRADLRMADQAVSSEQRRASHGLLRLGFAKNLKPIVLSSGGCHAPADCAIPRVHVDSNDLALSDLPVNQPATATPLRRASSTASTLPTRPHVSTATCKHRRIHCSPLPCLPGQTFSIGSSQAGDQLDGNDNGDQTASALPESTAPASQTAIREPDQEELFDENGDPRQLNPSGNDQAQQQIPLHNETNAPSTKRNSILALFAHGLHLRSHYHPPEKRLTWRTRRSRKCWRCEVQRRCVQGCDKLKLILRYSCLCDYIAYDDVVPIARRREHPGDGDGDDDDAEQSAQGDGEVELDLELEENDDDPLDPEALHAAGRRGKARRARRGRMRRRRQLHLASVHLTEEMRAEGGEEES